MKIDYLAALYEQHLHDKNYQFKNKTADEIAIMAKASFDRLTEDQQKKVFTVCKKFDLVDVPTIRKYRFLAQTNLFFLCKLLEKYKDTTDLEYTWIDGTVHNTHEEICNDFFVRKDPTKTSFKTFASQYIDKKQRLLLVPRGGYKSSIDMADCVQWIICFPEVTILVLTGVLDLAKDFVGEIKGHFELDDADSGFVDLFQTKKALKPRIMHDGSSSLFQVLFPEHCIPKDEGKGYEYQTPAVSVVDKETTVFAASIEQNLAGWHVGVMKLDDVVTNENSQTVERLKNVNKQVSINQAMLHPYGFYDKIGTWYDGEDTYGQDIKNQKKYETDGDEFPMKIYLRPAWWPTKDAIAAGKIEEEMTEQDYCLWFNDPSNPSSLTYQFLKDKKRTDPWFAIKYLNDPTQMHAIKFPRELLIRRTCDAVELPDAVGMTVTCVDTAYTTNSWSDYTVIITAVIYGGRFYIIDMKRGKFNEYELPVMVAATAAQWKPRRICIEASNAMPYVQREVYREMDKMKVRVPIELVPLGQGNKNKNSKKVKAGPVLRFLGDDRLKFLKTCPGLEELYDELSKFGTAASQHDDIVDALALLVNQFSGYADIEGKMTAASTGYTGDPKGKQFYDLTYGDGKFDKFNAKNAILEFPDMHPSELAHQAAADAWDANNDPLHDLMG